MTRPENEQGDSATATRIRGRNVGGRRGNDAAGAHMHRTAKVVELMGTSTEGFEDAIRNCLEDASQSTRGITGAHVVNWSVSCEDGQIVQYKVDLKVAFGIERT